MSITITLAVKGDQMGSDYTATMDGKAAPLKGSDRFDTVSVRRIGKNQLEFLESKGGDVIVGAYWELLPGRKRFVRRGIAKGADGRSYEYEEFFDKQ
jgi:hypothetical protein